MPDLPRIPRPEVHLCVPEHLSDPNYEDTDEGADSRIMRNTLLVLVGPWLVIGLLYVGYLAATGGL